MILSRRAENAGYLGDIEQDTRKNDDFRRVLFTGPHSQLVVMSLSPKEDIGLETHEDTDQFIRIEQGSGTVIRNGNESSVEDGSAVVIPAGVEHNIINTSATAPLRLYTIYSPPKHEDGLVQSTKP